VQYAREMGLNVAAVDIDDGKLALAKRLGATVTVNESTDPVSYLKERDRRRPRRASHGRFSECLRASARHGTMDHLAQWIAAWQLSAADLRHGADRITVRGSIVGTRLDLQEALEFAGAGKVRATVATERLENINDVFSRMHAGAIDGRVSLSARESARNSVIVGRAPRC
jgi:propanol-preferring alcohol dehydrogenase